jgi:hypothetical protein
MLSFVLQVRGLHQSSVRLNGGVGTSIYDLVVII